ncbi:MAG: glucose-6-phosphate isomerase family protein, partial [Candidatus Nanohaloarchaea archaeon]|nr:glucose-6-phosphate isomerase family protein [Candidatus Nanohaloarchaea archaeon]
MAERTLKFGDITREPDIRMLYDMKEVVWDRSWLRDADNMPLYYMYRDLMLEKHRQAIKGAKARYDITVMPPNTLGKEYVKTKGHYHPEAAPGVSYPEIYEVIQGEAHYLLQRKEENEVTDVIVVEAEAGDKVIIPPNYGHITINPSDTELRMANWVSRKFESIYEDITEKRGGVYYETTDGEFVENDHYDQVPELRRRKPVQVPDLGITNDKPMYKMIQDPDNLAFLNKPQNFGWVFEQVVG